MHDFTSQSSADENRKRKTKKKRAKERKKENGDVKAKDDTKNKYGDEHTRTHATPEII